jgi:large subunit ribosomal protein L25
MITLTCKQREGTSRGVSKRLRRDGMIPYVLYAQGKVIELGACNRHEIENTFRSLRSGFLPTTVFLLKDGKNQRKAIVKEIQYAPTTYEVIHIDFMELVDNHTVEVNVPVECSNIADCLGVKLGGWLRHVLRHIKVRCLPKDIPSHFELDVKDLDVCKGKRVKDLNIPKNVESLVSLEEVVVSVVKRNKA